LALTFGTLLSSQGTDAHPSRPLDLSGGNPINVTRCGLRCQTAPSRPGLPLWGPEEAHSAFTERATCWGLAPGPTKSVSFDPLPVRFPVGKD